MQVGKSYPQWAMDFDHVRGRKEITVSKLVNSGASRRKLDYAPPARIELAHMD